MTTSIKVTNDKGESQLLWTFLQEVQKSGGVGISSAVSISFTSHYSSNAKVTPSDVEFYVQQQLWEFLATITHLALKSGTLRDMPSEFTSWYPQIRPFINFGLIPNDLTVLQKYLSKFRHSTFLTRFHPFILDIFQHYKQAL